jgi:hypothetical protein
MILSLPAAPLFLLTHFWHMVLLARTEQYRFSNHIASGDSLWILTPYHCA